MSQPYETSPRRGGSADRQGLSWSDRWHRAEGGWKYKGQMEGSQRMTETEEDRDGGKRMERERLEERQDETVERTKRRAESSGIL